MKVRILGCGSSGGVPRLGSGWGACDPGNPRNRRSRCSLLLRDGARALLIDTSPDMREQLLAAEVTRLDAVLYTHVHADQAHGIDDLRGLALVNRARVPVHAHPEDLAELVERFPYCFRQIRDYPPILDANELTRESDIAGFAVRPVRVRHGVIDATGYRIGRLGYLPDVSDIPDDAAAAFEGLDVLILDALRYRRHPSHLNVAEALDWIARLEPRRAVLTNLHVDLDYETLRRTLPDGVEPAYDGMEITIAADRPVAPR
jgi:phosphoribosyl 1,2-cyclic phosphate phosphodiesterase